MEDQNAYIQFAANLVQNNIENIFKGIFSVSSKGYKTYLIKSDKAFKNYYKTAIGKYFELKTILYRDKPVPLYEFYVDLDIKIQNNIIQTHSINDILHTSKSLIIKGIAGCGKSTLLRHLFLNSIKEQSYIPIFIEMRNINDIDCTFLEFVYQSMVELNFDLEEEFFLQSLKKGKYIFFLDGFDEITPKKYSTISKEVIKFRDKYYDNCFIISSRHDDEFISWNNFHEAELLPLTKDKSKELISKIDYDTEIKKRFLEEIDTNLFVRYESFLSNPLLTTIMLLTFTECADIPNKMHLFFAQAFNTLYYKHDATKAGYKRKKNTNLPIDDFKNVFSCFCIQSYLKNEINFSHESIISYLELSKTITNIDFHCQSYFKDLNKSLCILIQDGLKYTFTHRTFQEYFAALFIVHSNKNYKMKLLEMIEPRLYRDKVFSLIFEINRHDLEEYYLIPKFHKILADCNFNNNSIEDFVFEVLEKSFDDFSIDISQKHVSFVTYSSSKQETAVKYYHIVYFVIRHYHNIFNDIRVESNIRFKGKDDYENHFIKTYESNKKLIRKTFKEDIRHTERGKEISYKLGFGKIKNSSAYRKLFFQFQEAAFDDFKFFINVFTEIQKEQDRKENSLDILLSEISNKE